VSADLEAKTEGASVASVTWGVGSRPALLPEANHRMLAWAKVAMPSRSIQGGPAISFHAWYNGRMYTVCRDDEQDTAP
jgi:hypothetical protein